ncbi:MAG: hypothetical protein JOS17DRAFT_763624 [Linnemannia elongata]|nr:MAG: hypothetical protein JOS17DRAFT_763624 [Linnemannia elongata]
MCTTRQPYLYPRFFSFFFLRSFRFFVMVFFSVLDIVFLYLPSFLSLPVFVSYEVATYWDRQSCGRVSRSVFTCLCLSFSFLFLMSSFFFPIVSSWCLSLFLPKNNLPNVAFVASPFFSILSFFSFSSLIKLYNTFE